MNKTLLLSLVLLGPIANAATQMKPTHRVPASLTLCKKSVENSTAKELTVEEQKLLVQLPRSSDEIALSKMETQKTYDSFKVLGEEFKAKLETRAAELAPKNPPQRINFSGVEYVMNKQGVVKISEGGQETVIFSSSLLPKDASLSDFRISPDGKRLTVGYSFFGSDWQIWKIYSTETSQFLEKEGHFVFKNFGSPVTWNTDSSGVIYVQELGLQADYVGKRSIKIMFHQLGTSPKQDRVLFESFENPDSSRWQALSLNNREVIVFRTQGVATIPMSVFKVNRYTGERFSLTPPNKYFATTPGSGIVGLKDGIVYLRSSEAGDRFGLVALDSKSGASKILVKQKSNETLYQAQLVGDKILAQYIGKNLEISFDLYDLQGRLIEKMRPSDFGLTDIGHPSLPLLTADSTSTTGYFTFSSIQLAPVTFKVDTATNKFTLLESGKINFKSDAIALELVEYPSFDGKKIKMYIAYRKDIPKKDHKFIYQYSYGYIGIPNLPQYNRKFQLALEQKGIVAIPAIRGGGEFGLEHQLAGSRNRLVTFLDDLYARHWLIAQDEFPIAKVGRSFGGMGSLAAYVNFHKYYDFFSAIVPVGDISKNLQEMGWWATDDMGVQRDPKTGKVTPESLQELENRLAKWNPATNLSKLDAEKTLKPLVLFAGGNDTNANATQAVDFFKQVKERHPHAPISLVVHEGKGHGARAELVEEFLAITQSLNLNPEDFIPLRDTN